MISYTGPFVLITERGSEAQRVRQTETWLCHPLCVRIYVCVCYLRLAIKIHGWEVEDTVTRLTQWVQIVRDSTDTH